MRKLLLLTALLLTAAVAWACGDKLMLVMGGARLSSHAVILAYEHQNTASSAVIRGLQSQPALRKAGHTVQVVEDPARLDSALKTGKYDLVMADVSDADDLTQLVRSAPSRPVVLPVAYNSSKEEQTAAQKKFHCLLKAPSNSDQYLAAIDQAMDWRSKAVRR